MKANSATEVPPRPVQLEMYYYLRLTRALDERAQVLYRQSKVVGGLFSSLGQEAISIGSAFALEKGDYVGPMIRASVDPSDAFGGVIGSTSAFNWVHRDNSGEQFVTRRVPA